MTQNIAKQFLQASNRELVELYLSPTTSRKVLEESETQVGITRVSANVIKLSGITITYQNELLCEYIIRAALSAYGDALETEKKELAYINFLEVVYELIPIVLEYNVKGKSHTTRSIELLDFVSQRKRDWLDKLQVKRVAVTHAKIEASLTSQDRSWLLAHHVFNLSDITLMQNKLALPNLIKSELNANDVACTYENPLKYTKAKQSDLCELYLPENTIERLNAIKYITPGTYLIAQRVIELVGPQLKHNKIPFYQYVIEMAIQAYESEIDVSDSYNANGKFIKEVHRHLYLVFNYKLTSKGDDESNSQWNCLEETFKTWSSKLKGDNYLVSYISQNQFLNEKSHLLAHKVFARKDLEHLGLPPEGCYKIAENGFSFPVI